jgi:hypothetical protein
MDFKINRYSSTWRHDNAYNNEIKQRTRFEIAGKQLWRKSPKEWGLDWDAGDNFSSKQAAETAIQEVKQQLQHQLNEIKRGKLWPAELWGQASESEIKQYSDQWQKLLSTVASWRVEEKK